MRRLSLVLVVVLSSFLMLAPAARVHAQSTTYYLALGDSLAYGYQPDLLDLGHGYVQDLYNNMLPTQPNLKLENLGCVDESTTTMLGENGTHCPYWQYTSGMTTTPQITQTLSFIQAHPGQISLVTIDIGANDLLQALQGGITKQKLLQLIQQLAVNLDVIFATLRTQVGPTVPIATMTYYNPLIVISSSSLITVGAELFNHIIVSTASRYNVTVAPVFNAFNSGTISQQRHNICTLTWFCSLSHLLDPHCRTNGYTLIAQTFEQAGIGGAERRRAIAGSS